MPFSPVEQDALQRIRAKSLSDRFAELNPATEQEQAQLDALAAVESSGGVDTDHPVIKSPASMHSGQKAIGEHALMPKTADLVLKRAVRDQNLSPQLAGLQGASEEDLAASMSNDEPLRKEIALRYLRDISSRSQKPEEVPAKWLHGPNVNKKRLKKELQSPRNEKYVEELKKRLENIQNKQAPLSIKEPS